MKTISAIMAFLLLKIWATPPPIGAETILLPISFALTCAKDTQEKITLYRDKNATADVSAEECIDKERMTQDAPPLEIAMSYLPSVEHYEIEIKLNHNSARELETISRKAGLRRLVIIRDHKVITSGLISTPHEGNLFQISAPDRDTAERIINLISASGSDKT
jgi:preprotein translocase subunit SecD